tara:strand:+ start:3052 stop:3300 length:249 start_codon:yes stop_codon:yes gene_type:complete
MTTTPKKGDPLTHEEVTEAADIFFPLFNEVHSRMPDGSTTEDTLRVMESVAKLGHKFRADKLLEEKSLAFGFNKEDADGLSD